MTLMIPWCEVAGKVAALAKRPAGVEAGRPRGGAQASVLLPSIVQIEEVGRVIDIAELAHSLVDDELFAAEADRRQLAHADDAGPRLLIEERRNFTGRLATLFCEPN